MSEDFGEDFGTEVDATADWMDRVSAERDLLRRLVNGLGLRLVVVGAARRAVVGNPSMSLSPDEVATLGRLIRGGE